MSNIGLCLAFKGTNYGALLQAYATQYIIENMGHKTEIIDYTPGLDRGLILNPLGIGYFSLYKIKSVIRRNRLTNIDSFHELNIQSRIEIANYFRNTRLNNIVKINGKRDLIKHTKKYNVLLVGSDQLWPPEVGFTYFHTLQFAPKGIRKVSFATSMGVSDYPWYVKRADSRYLKKFDYLSVREESGKQIIKDISGKDAIVVLDPTYLISKDEWETLIPKERLIEGDYVFSYFLGDNQEMKKNVRSYAAEKGYKVVCIVSNEVSVDDSFYADIILTGQTPDNFINLIRYAKCVFTDSFHGFAFSIINQVQVFVSYRIIEGLKSRNTRIDNIVNTFMIPDRLITNPGDRQLPDTDIDYSIVNRILINRRNESIEFLRKALNTDY